MTGLKIQISNDSMRILFIGDSNKYGYSFYQYSILKKIYSDVKLIDFANLNIFIKYIKRLSWYFNPKLFDLIIYFLLKKKFKLNFDLIYIHNENLIGERTIKFLKLKSKKIFFYCPDNPFVDRDKQRWKLIVKNLNQFDLIIFMQKNRFKYAKKLNLKKTVWIPPTFKVEHQKKRKLRKFEFDKYKIDIVIIGTWFPERGDLVLKLIKNNFKLKIYGGQWEKFKYYKKYIDYFGKKIMDDDLYVKLIQSAKLSICLPSKANDDDITNKSLEIPYIGTLLLAKKTKTHSEIFKENKEAIFFENNNHCIKIIKKILKNENQRLKIAKAGHKRINKNISKLSFENNIQRIFKEYLSV